VDHLEQRTENRGTDSKMLDMNVREQMPKNRDREQRTDRCLMRETREQRNREQKTDNRCREQNREQKQNKNRRGMRNRGSENIENKNGNFYAEDMVQLDRGTAPRHFAAPRLTRIITLTGSHSYCGHFLRSAILILQFAITFILRSLPFVTYSVHYRYVLVLF
jgi:hypothetical protein